MHDVIVTSHELIFVALFVELPFFLANKEYMKKCNYSFQYTNIVYLRT